MRNLNACVIVFGLLMSSIPTFAQRNNYISNIDNELKIKSLVVRSMTDNVSGIYAKTLTQELIKAVEDDRQWTLRPNLENFKASLDELESKPELAKSLGQQTKSDAILASRLSKGPQGLSIQLSLISANDGQVMVQSQLQNYSGFEMNDLKSEVRRLFLEIKKKLPYQGRILSRTGLLVTLDIGSRQGLANNAEVSVIQILKVQRHPKFKFIIGTDKEILGKIKIQKVDENLSFGTISFEKEEGVIKVQQKVLVDSYVVYPETPSSQGEILEELGQRKDSKLSLGDKPSEWVPERTPTFGKLGVMFGVGTYNISNNLTLGGGVSGSNSFVPSIHVNGELWFDPNWSALFEMRQYVFSISNSYSGSSPSRLNVSTNQYSVLGSYNFLLAEQFFGPKIQLSGGYSKFTSFVDQSTPTAFTSNTYGGLMLGLGGSFPLVLESKVPVSLGARMDLFWNPSMSESPVDSGSAKANVTSFQGFFLYKYSARMNLKGKLMYDLFSANFTGSGTRNNSTESATSSSHTVTTLAGGLEYLF